MSWSKVKLGEVCSIEKGATGILKAIPGEFPMVVTSEKRKSHNEFQFDCEAAIVPLVSGTGHGHASIKRIHFQKGKFALGSILCAIIPKDKTQLSAEYLYRFLDLNKEDELVARMKGMANVTLPLKEIAQIEIPLPSLIEQKEFVENYEILETQSDLLSTELTHQLNLVKKLRQQLLQDAVQGKLIEQNKKDEPASELLKKIKAIKAKLIAEKKLKKEKELPPIKPEEIPFEIPENWVWCRLGDAVGFLNGYAFKSEWFKSDGIPLLRNINLGIDELIWNDVAKLPENKLSEFREYLLAEGDIILSLDRPIINAGLKIAQIRKDDLPCLLLQRVLKISPIIINQKYIYQWFRSSLFIKEINPGRSIGIPHISHNDVSKILFPLPPLSEQNRIVQKLDELMQYCNELEASIQQSAAQNEKLLQQVLREALRKEPVEA